MGWDLNLGPRNDLAFLVQMYELAYASYHTAKRDFGNDQAWMHFAGASVSFTKFILWTGLILI